MKIQLPPAILVLLVGSLISGCKDDKSPSAPQPPSLHWEVTNLSAGTVLAMAVNNAGTVFASIDGDGIYKSTDHGTTWTKPMTGPFQGSTGIGYARRFLVDGFTLWAGTKNAGIHRSRDEGVTWEEVAASVPVGTVFDLCLARESAFCASDSGIYVLTEADQWKRIDKHPVYAICGDRTSTHVFAGGRYETSVGFSTAAIIWSPMRQGGWYAIPVSSGLGVSALAQAPNGTFFAGTLAGGMLRKDPSYDRWWSWEPIGGTEYWGSSGIAVAPNNDVYVFMGNQIQRSTDNGDSWAWCSEGFAQGRVHSLVIDPAGYIFAGTAEGVFRARF